MFPLKRLTALLVYLLSKGNTSCCVGYLLFTYSGYLMVGLPRSLCDFLKRMFVYVQCRGKIVKLINETIFNELEKDFDFLKHETTLYDQKWIKFGGDYLARWRWVMVAWHLISLHGTLSSLDHHWLLTGCMGPISGSETCEFVWASEDMGLVESEGKKWVITGISVRGQMRPINTKPRDKECEEDEESCSTTPTAKEARIPETLPCPPAPRKRKPSSRCHYNGSREFFTPPDLETVFIRHVERAN
ncbi:hypothetical protein RJ641_006980 [Dillenia turbinata]|uniref:Uncharacterized protein n=1 Tax=Dillenia turbinata TaxID=194707 RepID=A0AAN8V7T8_9MAGN